MKGIFASRHITDCILEVKIRLHGLNFKTAKETLCDFDRPLHQVLGLGVIEALLPLRVIFNHAGRRLRAVAGVVPIDGPECRRSRIAELHGVSDDFVLSAWISERSNWKSESLRGFAGTFAVCAEDLRLGIRV